MSTMRDRVEAQRAGFVAGIRATSSGRWTPAKQAAAESLAAGAYPAPTYERPRLVTQGMKHFKVVDGMMFMRSDNGPGAFRDWNRLIHASRENTAALLDLWDNPSETVEVQ